MGHTKHHMKMKHHRKDGGGVSDMKGREERNGEHSNVMHEAKEKKHGGGVHFGAGCSRPNPIRHFCPLADFLLTELGQASK